MRTILYTPVYYTSPGTQARLDLVRKSLQMAGHKTVLITGHETWLQNIYHTLGERLLKLENIWKIIGKYIVKAVYKQKPEAVILFLDVSAAAVPYLKRSGIYTILSIEDLTPEYKSYDSKAANKFYQTFVKYAEQADIIISPSYTLSKRLEQLGLKAITVPIGLEPLVSLKEALARPFPPILLHSGQLNMQRKVEIILSLANRYRLLVHNFGNLAAMLHHPNVIKYRGTTLEEVVSIVRQVHVALILEYRRAYTLSRLYFHTSLLQPIVADGWG
ncbi:MAG: hypothetical protein ACPLSA_08560, partial [Caldanaerobacter sp.]